jgi:uncharacterized membrane protein YqjE
MGETTVFETLHKSKQISVIAMDRIGDYIELLRIEMKLQGRELGVLMLGYAVGAIFGLLAAIFIGFAIIVSFWDTPYRTGAAWFVVFLYAVVAAVSILVARKHIPSRSAFSTLRNELKRDVELVKETI